MAGIGDIWGFLLVVGGITQIGESGRSGAKSTRRLENGRQVARY